MRRKIYILISVFVLLAILTSCNANKPFDNTSEITVVSREDGSGTRSSFVELFEMELKGDDGSRTDITTNEAVIVNKTGIMLINVESDPYSIGYVSLGSLDDSVKALKIDGVSPTSENIMSGEYTISRSFNIATKGAPNELAADFIKFILSREGQNVVSTNYVPVITDAPSYPGNGPEGKIVVAGSSSVTPIMEKLKEAYILLNPKATVEIQQSDSSTGLQGAIDGTCDIAMSSRELKDTELENLESLEIALDGIVLVANSKNPITGLSSEEVRKIFSGEITHWNILP